MATRAVHLAWFLWALAVTLQGLALLLWAGSGFPPGPNQPDDRLISGLLRGLGQLSLAGGWTIGAVIAARRPNNPIGWLVCAAGCISGYSTIVQAYVEYARTVGPIAPLGDGAVVAWVDGWLGVVGTALIGPILLLLPDGQLPSRRWRPVLWLIGGCAAVAITSFALMPGPLLNARALTSPFGIAGAGQVLILLLNAATVVIPFALLLAAGSLVVRFRQARGHERQQLKWIALGAVVWCLALAFGFAAPRDWRPLVGVVNLVAFDVFAVSLGLAILKYRLYEVDLVINKALAYGALALAITGAYVAVVVGVGALIGTRGEPNPATGSSQALGLSLLATAVVAVAFQPVRERLQRLANRLVYGQRASPYDVLAGFSRRIAGALSVDEVLPRMAETAARGIGAPRSRVRVYVPGGHDQAVAWPAEAVSATFAHVVPVWHRAELVGEIAVDKAPGEPLTAAEEKLLGDLAAQAGPAFSNARLALELRAQTEELREREAAHRTLADEQAALRRVATLVASAPAQQRLFEAVTAEVGQVLGAQTANLTRFEGDHLRIMGRWSEPGIRAVPVGATLPLDSETAVMRVYRTGKPARLDAFDGLAGTLAHTLREIGIRCSLAAPIMVDGRLWGAVTAATTSGDPFPSGAEGRLGDFAELVAQAIANADARDQLAASRARIVEAGDKERRRIERDLHDGAQQQLVALAVNLQVARELVRADPGEAEALLAEVGLQAREALGTLRDLARGIYPPTLTDRGLSAALEAHLTKAGPLAKLQVDPAIVGARFAPEIEAAVYFCCLEALQNWTKHASGAPVRVRLGCEDGWLDFAVVDGGAGFDHSAVQPGAGLQNMADRLAAVGGHLDVRSRRGSGTTVTGRLPVRPAAGSAPSWTGEPAGHTTRH